LDTRRTWRSFLQPQMAQMGWVDLFREKREKSHA
jgi:hypothetical protein